MTETASLLSLFISSFLGATLLPGGSEAVLYAVLKAYPESLWMALAVGTTGNTLGGMVSFAMGWLLPQRKGGSEAAGHTPAYSLRVQTQQLKHVDKLRRYGTPALLLAWTPLLGDALCLAAGWLRLNWWQAALFMATGKFLRYCVIALL
jgi:membrane protein YqaA with SNARE-associated domain